MQAIAMPPGWEAVTDPQSGRIYYQNHLTRVTQWEPPSEPPVALPASDTAVPTPHVLPCFSNMTWAHNLQLLKGALTTIFVLYWFGTTAGEGGFEPCGSWALTGRYATPGGWAIVYGMLPGAVAVSSSSLFLWRRRSIVAAGTHDLVQYAKVLTPILKLSILAAALQFIFLALVAAEYIYTGPDPYNDPECHHYSDGMDHFSGGMDHQTGGEIVCQGLGYGKSECLALGTSADESGPCCQWDNSTVAHEQGWPSASGTNGIGACWSNVGQETCNIKGSTRRQGTMTALSMLFPFLLAFAAWLTPVYLCTAVITWQAIRPTGAAN